MNEPLALPSPEPEPQAPPDRPAPRRALAWSTGIGFLVLAAALFWVWRHPLVEAPPTEPLDRLAQQVSALEARVTKLEQRPQPQAPDLGPLAARVAALEQHPAAPQPQVDLAPLTARVTALEQRPPAAAPTQPAPDLGPLTARVAALEQRPQPDIAGIQTRLSALEAKQQTDDKVAGQVGALAEGQRTLQDDLTRRLAADEKATAHLAQVQAVQLALETGQKLGNIPGAPPALARFADANPPTEAALRLSFPQAAREALATSHPDAEGKPFLTRLWAQAEDLVTIRRGDRVVLGDPTATVLERARTALDAGDLAAAVTDVASLQGSAAQAMAGWLGQARALLDARAALANWAAHA